MTQLGHAHTQVGTRAKMSARTAMWITVWSVVVSLAMFLAVGQALAETYTPHARRVTARYNTAHFVTHHAGAGSARAAKVSSVRVRGRSGRSELVASRKVSARERVSSRTAGPALSSLRRVNGRRRRGGRRGRSHEPAVVAEAARPADATSDATLTVNDFAHAAGVQRAVASGAYASGVSQPDENVNASRPATPRDVAGSSVTASVEAMPGQRESAPLQRSAPSDLAGAPLTEPAHSDSRTTGADSGTWGTHEELAEAVAQPVVLPGLYRYGRLVVPPPMRGTREILAHQNLIADEEGLSRIQDDEDLRRMRADRMLVDFPESASLRVNAELASDRRCARPWTVRFATEIARAYYERFHQPLQVNSAVRTVAFQLRLQRVNGNAAGIGGEMASPHLTGQAIDFGKHDMSTAEIAWMRTYLRPLMQAGKVDVEEEFQQACFHISVYRSYAPDMPAARREVAQLH
jgi:hypothetical protein